MIRPSLMSYTFAKHDSRCRKYRKFLLVRTFRFFFSEQCTPTIRCNHSLNSHTFARMCGHRMFSAGRHQEMQEVAVLHGRAAACQPVLACPGLVQVRLCNEFPLDLLALAGILQSHIAQDMILGTKQMRMVRRGVHLMRGWRSCARARGGGDCSANTDESLCYRAQALRLVFTGPCTYDPGRP